VAALRSSGARSFGERGGVVRGGGYIGQGRPGKWARGHASARGASSGSDHESDPGTARGGGMTSGPHLAAAEAANGPALGHQQNWPAGCGWSGDRATELKGHNRTSAVGPRSKQEKRRGGKRKGFSQF
jgi:hypothetical protein